MAKVSVIIPTYNRSKYIRRAIDSVLKQTFTDYEIIVIDDGSTDNTGEILRGYGERVSYIRQSNQGISASRNRGIGIAKGKYIAFLDSDDEWVPEKLALQVKLLDNDERLGLVCSRMVILNEQGDQCGMKPQKRTGKNFRELVEIGGDLPTSTIMTRKECFDKVGVFDKDLPPMEDFEMWVRIASQYDVYTIPDKILAYYYRHGHQITSDKTLVYEATVKLDKAILDRYRHVPDFPIKTVVHKIAFTEYVLSRIYYSDRQYRNAFSVLFDAIKKCPFIGVKFFEKSDTVAQKLIKFFKPYGYFFVCLIHRCCLFVQKSVK